MKDSAIVSSFIGFITLGIWLVLRPTVYQLSAPACLAFDIVIVWCSAPTILGLCSELLLFVGLGATAATQKLCYVAGLTISKIAVLIDQINLIIPGNAFAYHANSRKVLVGSFYSVLEQKAKAKKYFLNLVKDLNADKDQSALKDLSNCLMLLSELAHGEGNYKEARSYAEQSLETLKKTAPDKTSEGAMLTDLCGTYMKQGLIDEAISIGRRAVECFDMTDDALDHLQAIAYNNLSLAHCEAGEYREALDCSRRSLKLKLAASANKPNLSVAIAHVNIADHLLFLERYDDALAAAKNALEILDTLGFGDSIVRATVLQNLGHAYLGLGKLEEAKANLVKGAASKGKFMAAKDPEWAQLNLDLARLYAALSEKTTADSHFGKAVDFGEKLLGLNNPKLAYIYKEYAKYLDITHREGQAEVLRAKAKEIEERRAKLKGDK
ncbi:MAG: tetratricopeptide repeat protein [Candidatus Melainabacteria bacterium]|nr:tetratricopeptide repeat protein [Candidatus Melainabacteria bacterium]